MSGGQLSVVDAGKKLNKRVWQLFENAGFQTAPNSANPAEEKIVLSAGKPRTVDLSATIPSLGVKIIGENTTSKTLAGSFTTEVNDLKTLMNPYRANAGLLVYTRFEPSESDRRYAEGNHIKVWEDRDLRYYEKLVETIGKYARYEMIHSFGLKTTEEALEFTTLALQFKQPTSVGDAKLYLFTIPPKRLLQTAVVLRKAQGSAEAYQRILNKTRLPKIGNFVKGPDAVLPTNVILGLSDLVKWEALRKEDLKDSNNEPFSLTNPADFTLGVLRIPLKYASLELIDGQHRLFGFIEADDDTMEHFNLVALGIMGLNQTRRRDTFVAINDNARRVDPNLVAFLKYTDNEAECQADPEKMAIKIVTELNKSTPFKGKIRMIDFPDEIITLKGFSGYDLRGLIGPKGWLRKLYDHESSVYISVLRMYFSILKSLFPLQWKDQQKYITFTNRGISAFLKLLRSMLRTEDKQLNEASMTKYLNVLKQKWKDPKWEIAKLRSAYVGSGGWSDFHKDLAATIRKKFKNFKS